MSLSPSDVRALDEIANDFAEHDPNLAVMLTVGPTGFTPARSLRGLRVLAVLLCVVAYAHAEIGLIRGPVTMVYHAVALAAVAVVVLVVAGRRAARLAG
jgi:hypothetical protein